jgi:hypothetical protein
VRGAWTRSKQADREASALDHGPDWFHQLALTAHVGQPMIGQWDVAGVVACLVIGIGGILLGAWGVTRRDIAR